MSTISSLRKAIEALDAAELALSDLVDAWPKGGRWKGRGEAVADMYAASLTAGDDLRHMLKELEREAIQNQAVSTETGETHGE